MSALLGSGRGRLALVLTVLGVGGWLLYSELTKEDGPANFEATLPDMQSDFGEETRVLTVEDVRPDTGIAWEVLSPDGKVTRRVYTFETETSYTPQSGYSDSSERKEDDSERDATAVEEKRAQLTLSKLDPKVLVDLCEQTGVAEFLAEFELEGKTWTLESNTGFDRFTANYDGTGVKPVAEADGGSAATCDP